MARNMLFTVAGLLALTGCSGRPPRVHPPTIDPDQAAAAALQEYDTDGDGALAADELDRVPGIKRALTRYDLNGDQRVTADELARRVKKWSESRVGIGSPFGLTVKLDGRPLEGATVRLVPERFLGPAVKAGVGTTDQHGVVYVVIPEEDLPTNQKDLKGVQLALYKIEITHPTKSIPARYNTETTLGQDIAYETLMTTARDLVLELSSRQG
jgi:hypothetical protein